MICILYIKTGAEVSRVKLVMGMGIEGHCAHSCDVLTGEGAVPFTGEGEGVPLQDRGFLVRGGSFVSFS